MKIKLKYSLKFIWGIILVVLSFVIGIITKILFFLYIDERIIASSMVALYIVSWPMLFVGAWWAGKEYAESIKRYFRYRYYHKYVSAGAKKVVAAGKKGTKGAIKVTKVVGSKAKQKGVKIRRDVTVKINNNKKKLRNKRIQKDLSKKFH